MWLATYSPTGKFRGKLMGMTLAAYLRLVNLEVCVWCCVAVITGGLDSKLVMWGFSKGRPQKLVDFGVPDADNVGSAGQCLNPAFVHAIAVPEVDMVDRLGKVCVVARGDGVVDVIDIESELAVIKSQSSLKPRKGTQ
ncbi:hypothetical protein ACSBR2_028774 [Camellia fascicularis]